MLRPRVLVIDDDDQLCAHLKHSFEAAGYEVEIAQTSEQGVELVQAFLPQVVLFESRLDAVDGMGVFDQLRKESDAAIIFLTSQADKEAVANALWQGASDYVTKPFHMRELLARTRAILRRKHVLPRAATDSPIRIERPPNVNPLLQ